MKWIVEGKKECWKGTKSEQIAKKVLKFFYCDIFFNVIKSDEITSFTGIDCHVFKFSLIIIRIALLNSLNVVQEDFICHIPTITTTWH